MLGFQSCKISAMESLIRRKLPASIIFGKLNFHSCTECCYPRKRPGTRNPLPDEVIQKRVEEIVFRYRKKKKERCPECIDSDFDRIGKYRVKDEEIQRLYKEYLRLYHPEQVCDLEEPKDEQNQEKSSDNNTNNKSGST